MSTTAFLALADGTIMPGRSIGAEGVSVAEVVFNTAMTGYQEILTDPSYAQQIVLLTYPHIGNTGTNTEDVEANTIYSSGLIVRDVPTRSSNWRESMPLQEYLKVNNIVAIADLDTRALTRHLRENGAQPGCIAPASMSEAEAIEIACQFPGIAGLDLAKEVTTDSIYQWSEGTWRLGEGYEKPETGKYRIAALDYGIKHNILRLMSDRGCHIDIYPAKTNAKDILAKEYDGIFLSNGPGDPEPCDYAISAIEEFIDAGVPTFGICLGHQLLALASGAKTMKMKNGHHGANHPVIDLRDDTVMITSQNHGFCVAQEGMPDHLTVTHRSLFDNTIQGIAHKDKPAFGFQGHPEASPGPHDIQPLFDQFISLIDNYRTQ